MVNVVSATTSKSHESIHPSRPRRHLCLERKMILLSVGDRMHIDLRRGHVRFSRNGKATCFRDENDAEQPFEFSSLPNSITATQIAELFAAVHGFHLTRLSSAHDELVFEFG